MNRILENREIKDGIIIPIKLEIDKNGKPLSVGTNYINIGYQFKDSRSKVLSNLYYLRFKFEGMVAHSLEGVIQSFKYENIEVRKECFLYHGLDSVNLKGMIPYKWQKDRLLYTKSGKIDRGSITYQDYLDKLYLAAFENPLYQEHIKGSIDYELDHYLPPKEANKENELGSDNTMLSTLTRTEYISRLYALRYCLKNDITNYKEKQSVLKRVREELKD